MAYGRGSAFLLRPYDLLAGLARNLLGYIAETRMDRAWLCATSFVATLALGLPATAQTLKEVNFVEAVHNLGYINLYVGQHAKIFEKRGITLLSMLFNPRVLHIDSLAKYAAAFFRISFSSRSRLFSCRKRLNSASCSVTGCTGRRFTSGCLLRAR